jgi:hypothetical protein
MKRRSFQFVTLMLPRRAATGAGAGRPGLPAECLGGADRAEITLCILAGNTVCTMWELP